LLLGHGDFNANRKIGRRNNAWQTMLRSLGELYTLGAPVDWQAAGPDGPRVVGRSGGAG